MGTTRKKRGRGKPPVNFDSWFEFDLHKKELKNCRYHTIRIDYVQKRSYEPDFIYTDAHSNVCYIETKGRFRDRAEARKYVDVAAGLKPYEQLVFVFADGDKPMPGASRRRDGTRQTHGEWATKNNFIWYEKDTVPKEWGRV